MELSGLRHIRKPKWPKKVSAPLKFRVEDPGSCKISDNLANSCKTHCKVCGNAYILTYMRIHTVNAHGMQITKYKEMYGQFEIIEKVFHKCHLCGKIVLFDSDTLGAHIKRAHQMKEKTYKKKFCISKPAATDTDTDTAGADQTLKMKKPSMKKLVEEPHKTSPISQLTNLEKERSEENEILKAFFAINCEGKPLNAGESSMVQSDLHRDNTAKEVTMQKSKEDFVVLERQDCLTLTQLDRAKMRENTNCFNRAQKEKENRVSMIQQSVEKKEVNTCIPEYLENTIVGTTVMKEPIKSEVMEEEESEECTMVNEDIKHSTIHMKEEPSELMEEGEVGNFFAEGVDIREDIKDSAVHIKVRPLESLVEIINTKEDIKESTVHIKVKPLQSLMESTIIQEDLKESTVHIKVKPLESLMKNINTKEDIKDNTVHIKEEPLDFLVDNISARAAVFQPLVALPAVQGVFSKDLTEDYSLYTKAQLGEMYRSRGLWEDSGDMQYCIM